MYVLLLLNKCSVNVDQVKLIDSVVQFYCILTDFLHILSIIERERFKSTIIVNLLFLLAVE